MLNKNVAMSERPKSATRQTLLLLGQSDFLCCAAPVVSPLSHQKKRPPGCSTLLPFICSVYLLLHLSKTRWWFNFITCQLCQIKQVHEGKIWMRLPCTENQNISNQQKHWSLIGHRTISESIRVSCNSSDQSQTTYSWTIKTVIIMEYSYFFDPLELSKKPTQTPISQDTQRFSFSVFFFVPKHAWLHVPYHCEPILQPTNFPLPPRRSVLQTIHRNHARTGPTCAKFETLQSSFDFHN